MNNDIEVVWDFGISEDMNILVLHRNRYGNLEIYRRFKDSGKPIRYYIDMIKDINPSWAKANHHLPTAAYLNGPYDFGAVIDIFRSYGFDVDHATK